MKKLIYIALLGLTVISCAENKEESSEGTESKSDSTQTVNAEKVVDEIDHHTLSNYTDVRTKHLHLDIAVSFENKQITGVASHTIENVTGADHIDFDTK